MTPKGFEPAIPASERPQTHALDRAATETSPSAIYTGNELLAHNAADQSQITVITGLH